jgi:hypothetical protein
MSDPKEDKKKEDDAFDDFDLKETFKEFLADWKEKSKKVKASSTSEVPVPPAEPKKEKEETKKPGLFDWLF